MTETVYKTYDDLPMFLNVATEIGRASCRERV